MATSRSSYWGEPTTSSLTLSSLLTSDPMQVSMSTITEDLRSPYDPHDSMAFEYGDGYTSARTYPLSDRSSDYGLSWRRGSRQGILICVTFVIELLLLIFVIVVEYFLRWTDVFPLRRQNFTCSDPDISCSSREKQLMSDFAFEGNAPDEAMYALSFCVPAFVVLIGEIGLCTFSGGQQKSLRLLSKHCTVPQVARRLLRFLGVFLFGGFALMLLVDVTKMMTGRLSPDFLEICDVKESLCYSNSSRDPRSLDDSACRTTNTLKLRAARASFPSLTTALTSYAVIYTCVYVHGAMKTHSVRILRPFISLVLVTLSLLAGVAQYGRCISHWTDIVAGYAAGVAMGTYMSVGVVNKFQEHISQSDLLHLMRVYMSDIYLPYEDQSHLARPVDPMSLHLPRAYVPGPSLHRAGSEGKRRRQPGSFQRDLSQSVDIHRRHHPYSHPASHM